MITQIESIHTAKGRYYASFIEPNIEDQALDFEIKFGCDLEYSEGERVPSGANSGLLIEEYLIINPEHIKCANPNCLNILCLDTTTTCRCDYPAPDSTSPKLNKESSDLVVCSPKCYWETDVE